MELGKRLKISSSRLSQRQKLGLERTWFNELKRMDKLYIPGDLVMTNGAPLGTEQDVVYRVTSSDPSKTLKLGDGTVMKGVVRLENLEGVEFGDKGYLFGDCCAWVKDIVPIPITPEILEKNGWVKEVMSRGVKNRHWVYTKPDIEEYGYFPIYIEKGIGDEFDVYPFTDNNVCTQIAYIKYVHELQHLLFGLGINHEMEV